MKEVMKAKLSRIQDLDDRRLLKDILNYTFSELIDYCDTSYDNLVKSVYDQMEGEQVTHKIYTTVCKLEEYDPVDPFLYPMLASDTERNPLETDTVLQCIKDTGRAVIGRTFLQCDYLELKQILEADIHYHGKIVTESGSFTVSVQLAKCEDYASKIAELYYDCLANGLEWTSVNAPYIHKFVDFVITACEGLPAGEEIQEVQVTLGDAEQYRMDNMIPLWNLEPVQLQSTNFPIPTQDNIHFQHRIMLQEKNISYKYLVRFGRDNKYDGYCVRDSESVSIILEQDTIDYWPAYLVKEKVEGILYDYSYPLFSNGRKDSFMVRYAKSQGKVIRTKAELMRKLLSYEVSGEFQIAGLEFLEQAQVNNAETYSLNPFIEEDIRKDSQKKVMEVIFQSRKQDYTTRDNMSFLLSEVQSCFPEYKCEGRLL